MGEDGEDRPEAANGILMGSGGGSVASLEDPDTGGRGVEMDNNEAGSGVIVPDDSVNGCSPSGFFFFGFLDFFGVIFCCIINKGVPGGPNGEVKPG